MVNLAALILRLVLGGLLAGHGAQKLCALGIDLPRWLAPLGLVAIILTVIYDGPNDEAEQDEAREGAAGEDEA